MQLPDTRILELEGSSRGKFEFREECGMEFEEGFRVDETERFIMLLIEKGNLKDIGSINNK